MLNIWFIKVWILIFIIVILIVILQIQIKNLYVAKITQIANNIPNSSQSCNFDPAKLPIIENQICCTSGNIVFQNRELSLHPEYYISVCESACIQGVDSNGGCRNNIGSENYQKCLNTLNPGNCPFVALPYARIGNTLWYMKNYTSQGCIVIECQNLN
jgi:hypothetical protein